MIKKSKIKNPCLRRQEKSKINWKLEIGNWKFPRSEWGFTLLELVVAMAIIAIVSGSLWGNFFSSLIKGRDSRRKQNLEAVAKALEIYYYDNKAYPTPPFPSWGTPFVNPSNSSIIYMQRLPTDPAYPNSSYCYTADASGSYYKIYANLENRSDPAILATPVSCNGVDYNYGISSPNITP